MEDNNSNSSNDNNPNDVNLSNDDNLSMIPQDTDLKESLKKVYTNLMLERRALKTENSFLTDQISILKSQIKSLSNAPNYAGTVLNIGENSVRVNLDNVGKYEVERPVNIDLKKGSRCTFNGNKQIVGLSEFFSAGYVYSVLDIDGDHIKVSARGNEEVMETAIEGLKPGDEVMTDPTGSIIIKKLSTKENELALRDIKETPWNNIGGLEEVLSTIREEIEYPIKHRELFEKYQRSQIKGLLLSGPPGCGKTMIARGIAYNLDAKFIHINGPSILDKWLGNSEANVRKIYNTARSFAKEFIDRNIIIFLDEADALLKRRGMGLSSDCYDPIVNQFLAEMDGLKDYKNIITILATNREEVIDPAILRDGRIDRKIKIPRPNKEAIQDIFRIYLTNVPIYSGSNGSTNNIESLCTNLTDLIIDDSNIIYDIINKEKVIGNFRFRDIISGAMIKGIVDRAKHYAIKRELEEGSSGLRTKDFQLSLNDTLTENTDLYQNITKEDWEKAFKEKGREYQLMYHFGEIKIRKHI